MKINACLNNVYGCMEDICSRLTWGSTRVDYNEATSTASQNKDPTL